MLHHGLTFRVLSTKAVPARTHPLSPVSTELLVN